MTQHVLAADELVKHFVAKRSAFGTPLAMVKAVDGVSFVLRPGETLALVGESGCGKSTVGRLVMRLIEPTAGRIVLDGTDVTALSEREFRPCRRKVQLIFQDPFASLNPRMTIGDILAEPLMLHDIVPASERRARAAELLQAVGLEPYFAGRYPHEFSGGQRQRIVIARALAVEPKIVICDEPVSALDVSIRAQILNLLKELQARLELAYIFISHDLSVVKHIADRIAVMYLGRIVETGPADAIFDDPRHPYTRALLSAIPVASPHARRDRRSLEGDVPSPIDPPPGCHLHPRCPYAGELSRTQRPMLDDDGKGHATACHFWPTIPQEHDILPSVKLRPNVKFHDGEAMDAEAVKFSLERHITMQGSFRRPELASVERVKVIDPLTVRLHLKVPFSPLISQLTDRAGMMVSPKAAKEAGDKFGQKPVCAGPYRFVERVAQDRIVVEKFADYWNKGAVHIDRVIYQPIVDSTVRLANLKSGQLDLIERMLATDIKEVHANPRLKLATVTEIGYQSITINVGKGEPAKGPLGSDPRVRKALELSVDRDPLNQVVYNGEYVVGNQWVSPEHPYYQHKFPVPKRDVAKAKALIKEAGVQTPIVVDYMVPQNPETRQAAEVIQAMAAEAGFDMKIRVVEFATSLKEAEDGRYQAYMLNWSGRPDPDGNLYIFHHSKAPQNYGGYLNPQVDAWLEEARTKSSQTERKAIYQKVAEKLLNEGSLIYLFHRKWLIAHTAKLDGLKMLPDGLVRVVGLQLR